jgi:hypothetical protein
MEEVITYKETKDVNFNGNYMFNLNEINCDFPVYYMNINNVVNPHTLNSNGVYIVPYDEVSEGGKVGNWPHIRGELDNDYLTNRIFLLQQYGTSFYNKAYSEYKNTNNENQIKEFVYKKIRNEQNEEEYQLQAVTGTDVEAIERSTSSDSLFYLSKFEQMTIQEMTDWGSFQEDGSQEGKKFRRLITNTYVNVKNLELFKNDKNLTKDT